jgi:acyl carrier protein
MSIRSVIFAAMKQIAEEQQIALPPLDDSLSLHETGFDSLAFAILVARLEDDLGSDPFSISQDTAFPLTVGDFVRAYENVPA